MKDNKTAIFALAGLLVFLVDILTPLGFGVWLFYVALIYLFLKDFEKKHLSLIVYLYVSLIILGFFLSPDAQTTIWMPVFNRITASLILIIFSTLALKEKQAKKISSEILERIKDLFIAIDKGFRIIFLNKSAQQIIGLDGETAGKNYFELFPDSRNTVFEESFRKAITSQVPVHFEGELKAKGNYLDVSVYPSEGGLSVFAKDITKTVISERKLKKTLNEKEVLLRELFHRTKNNFQLILSLINLQLNNISDPVSIKILNETRSRILSITTLYDRLHLQGNYHTVDMNVFINEIVVKMNTAANFGIIKMDHSIEVDNVKLRLDSAIPIGLIINELYTNSLKYAFNGSRQGSVFIKMYFEDHNSLILYYRDNGKGFPEGFDFGNSGGLGSSIITSFVDQLEGSITCKNNNGAEFDIRLKIKEEESKQEEVPA